MLIHVNIMRSPFIENSTLLFMFDMKRKLLDLRKKKTKVRLFFNMERGMKKSSI